MRTSFDTPRARAARFGGAPSLALLRLVLALTAAIAAPTLGAGTLGKVVEFPVPNPGSLTDIAAGPDGNVWFTNNDPDMKWSRVGRVTPKGAITTWDVAADAPGAYGIAAGADGALWFCEPFANRIGRITTDGAVSEHPLPRPESAPIGITAGRDGALWFTEYSGNRIGRMTTAGSVTEFELPTPQAAPYLIAPAPDGSLWFTEFGAARVGRITLAGALTERALPSGASAPTGIGVASDGTVWFVESKPALLARISPAGVVSEVPTGTHGPFLLTVGPDDSVWFSEIGPAGWAVARRTPDGKILDFRLPTNQALPYAITVGPDRNIWLLERGSGRIARVTTGLGTFDGGSWMLPSSALRRGAAGAEFHTDVRVLNEDDRAVTVTPTFYDQASGRTFTSAAVTIPPRAQLAWDDVLSSVFGRSLADAPFGPIRIDADGPIVVSASVLNTHACGGASSAGQWLAGIEVGQAAAAGELLQIAASADGNAGKRTNLIFVNPGAEASATATLTLRRDGEALPPVGIGPLPPNGFVQIPVDEAHFAGLGGVTDTNLSLRFLSSAPLLAFASIIDNASGDPFATPAAPTWGLFDAAGDFVLPSAALRRGLNGAEFRTDVRLLYEGLFSLIVKPTFYDQTTGRTITAPPITLRSGVQVAYDNVLSSLFGRTLDDGSFGPIRFEGGTVVLVSASVNNVNACGNGSVAGQWLPGLDTFGASRAGVIGQISVSAVRESGSRTNVVFTNPANGPEPDAPAAITVRVRRGDGSLVGSTSIAALPVNGFRQIALDSSVVPELDGVTDTNLWLEFTSDHPVLAFASVIDNVSGDPFAVVATPEVRP